MPARISGWTLGYTAAGGILLWSGIAGTTLSTTFTDLLSGQKPSQNQQQIGSPVLDLASSSGSSPGSGSSPASPGPVPSTSNARAALQQAAAQHGWGSGAEWTALQNVEMREAGFSLTARNPSSGAYGMAQFINGPSEYAQYGGNSTTAGGQAVAMCNYIAERYGDPIKAWAHEQQYGWY